MARGCLLTDDCLLLSRHISDQTTASWTVMEQLCDCRHTVLIRHSVFLKHTHTHIIKMMPRDVLPWISTFAHALPVVCAWDVISTSLSRVFGGSADENECVLLSGLDKMTLLTIGMVVCGYECAHKWRLWYRFSFCIFKEKDFTCFHTRLGEVNRDVLTPPPQTISDVYMCTPVLDGVRTTLFSFSLSKSLLVCPPSSGRSRHEKHRTVGSRLPHGEEGE